MFYSLLFVTLLAANLQSPRYQLEPGSINIGPPKQFTNYNISNTLKEFDISEFQNNGFVVKKSTNVPFIFSLSGTNLSLGKLTANIAKTNSVSFSLELEKNQAYAISVAQEQALKTLAAKTIPNTMCDEKKQPCNKLTARPWSQPSRYGFGYNLKGKNIPGDFLNETYYRPLADLSLNEEPVTIISDLAKGQKTSFIMNFKINMSPSQETGTYQTVVKFVVTPSY